MTRSELADHLGDLAGRMCTTTRMMRDLRDAGVQDEIADREDDLYGVAEIVTDWVKWLRENV